MPKVTMYKQDGSETGDVELVDSVFGIEPNKSVMRDAFIMQQASQRQGTHKAKTRSEVSGGGRKPWRQKGTGRARQGSNRAPQWTGGGTVFGPVPRNYSYQMPRKIRRLALKSAYSEKVADEDIIVMEDIALDVPKTKEIVSMLDALDVDVKTLIVTSDVDETVERSANNLQHVTVLPFQQVSVFDLLKHDKLIITKDAAARAGEVLVQ